MKYVRQTESGAWDFEIYFRHLDQIRSRIPADLVDLIYNEERYVLNNPKSFHDAWLRTLKIYGPHECAPDEAFKINLCLLAPMHDKYFNIQYLTIDSYQIHLPVISGDRREITKRQDDLIVHEFDLMPDRQIEHRILFWSGMEIYINCSNIIFSEHSIETNPRT